MRARTVKSDPVTIDGALVRNPDLVRGGELEDAIESLESRGYNFLFVDTPPAFLPELEVACSLADFVVIPTRPDIENIKASRQAIQIARRAIKNQFLVVINAAPTRGTQEQAIRVVLADYGIPVAKQTLWQRVSHSKAADKGMTAAEVDDEAAGDIEALWEEIHTLVMKSAKEPVT